MLLKRAVLICGCSFLLLGVQALADPTFSIAAGTLTLSRLLPIGGGEFDDVRGLVEINVSGFANPVILTDSQNGTDPDFLAPLPFGNSSLTGFVVVGPQANTVAFNFGSAVFGTGGIATIEAVGTPIFPVPNTDPALLAFDQTLLFTLELTNFVNPVPGTTTALAQYSLSGISLVTPEPVLSGIVVLGLMMMFGYLRIRRNAAERS